jgi:16S rRNA (adenine1518-N6/adenine1519-N6)-dimethyltransferase
VKADKRLGQHFLRDPEVLADIAAVADVGRSAGALEIGPGEGALTAWLLRAGRPVVALEQDERAIAELAARFGGEGLVVHHGDATTADLAALLPRAEGQRAVVVGNLPYNAASLIHRRVLALGYRRVARSVLMFQKEVALRLVAGPGGRDYGVPSVLTAVVARAWIVREVPPTAFSPRPKIDSAVVLIEPRAEPLVGEDELEAFAGFVGRAFQQRRKTLANAMSGERELLEARGLEKLRAEALGPETWVSLWRAKGP